MYIRAMSQYGLKQKVLLISIVNQDMEDNQKPDPRFEHFEERLNSENIPIGFVLPGCDFLFEYDSDGGWFDEKGNYFNCDGVFQKKQGQGKHEQDKQDDEDELSENDEDNLDEFEKLLIDDEGGVIRKQKKQAESFQNETQLIKNYADGIQVRNGLPNEIFIFFKMRSKYYQRVQLVAQQKQSLEDKNKVAEINKLSIQQATKKLLTNNPWLQNDKAVLAYSGMSASNKTYDRYWYGWLKVEVGNYKQKISQIKKSNEFSVLQAKTYYALKSKFYLKEKMKIMVAKLLEQVKNVSEESLIAVTIGNLPELCPISFIYDLFQLSGVQLAEIDQVEFSGSESAEIICNKRGACKLVNLEGYCHDQKEFLELSVKTIEGKHKNTNMYFVMVDSPFKMHYSELVDTLALCYSKDQLLKQGQKNDKYRFVLSKDTLRKVLMFRGPSINIVAVSNSDK